MTPCPFCNQTPDEYTSVYSIGCWRFHHGKIREVSLRALQPGDKYIYAVHCECGARMTGTSREEAIQKWNTRK